jgi:hypothetical protein
MKAFVQMARLLAGEPVSSSAKWAVGDQWVKPSSDPDFTWKAEPVYFEVGNRRGLTGLLQIENGETLRAFCYPTAEDRWQARVGQWFLPIRRVVNKTPQQKPAYQKLTALVSGRIHSLLYREGAWIPAHESALLVESLNALISHALPVDVRLVRWLVSAEDQVQAGQTLAEFERAAQVR